jgi:hypothetical protein
MHVQIAPKEIQDLFDLQLQQIAARCGYKTGEHYIAVALGGVMYDYTLNFDSAHIIHAQPSFDGVVPG